MALINVTRKPVTTQGYQLTGPSDMLAALDYLKTRGYSGTINAYKSDGVNTVWQLTIHADSGAQVPQSGATGDWVIIENDTIASILPAAKAAVLYQVG